MKTLILLFTVVFALYNTFAQDVPGVANGSVARDSRDEYDNGIRLRSIELERVKNENYRSAIIEKAFETRKINYSQIKKDFEQVQSLQNQIIKTYITGNQIDYARIGELAVKLNGCAERLDANLLLSVGKPVKKSDKKISEPENVKDLIVVLDKTIGNFVTSPVFENLGVFETKATEKAATELQKIIRLSDVLAKNAVKQN